ncbi:pentapeptide repeat-containing protein [Catenulispora pinistramenti]|nr:pentapeptide repeat-containing protein [Catenulispora pinistramenti]
MAVSFSTAGVLAGFFTGCSFTGCVLAGVVLTGAVLTGALVPAVVRLASPAPDRRGGADVGREAALAPVAARVGLGTAWPAPAPAPACVAPVAACDAFVLLVVTAVILAL